MIQSSTEIVFQLLPDSLACRLYVLVVLIETIIDIAIEVELRAKVEDFGSRVSNNLTATRLPVYLAMFAAAQCVYNTRDSCVEGLPVVSSLFQLVMAIDAVHARNTLQFIFLTLVLPSWSWHSIS